MQNLKPLRLPLDKLCLDPNNPRFAEEDAVRTVPENRVHEDSVQSRTLERIRHDRYDIKQLQESIENVGFLPVDQLVVIPLAGSDKYMVIEGNRRLAALKSVTEAASSGEIDLPEEIRQSIAEIPVLVIEDNNITARNHFARVLQGVRHLSSVKQWGPYQQAQLVATMIRDGKSFAEIKGVLGLSTQRINSLRRVYFALEEMSKDPDFGDNAKPDLFSLFEEALKVPDVRSWLGWNDEANSCTNMEHRQQFYSWCISIEEDGERFPRKITDAKDIRKLPNLINDQMQFKRFIEDPRLTLAAAAAGTVPSDPEIDWRGILQRNVNALNQIPALAWKQAAEDDVAMLEQIRQYCDDLLGMIRNQNRVSGVSQ